MVLVNSRLEFIFGVESAFGNPDVSKSVGDLKDGGLRHSIRFEHISLNINLGSVLFPRTHSVRSSSIHSMHSVTLSNEYFSSLHSMGRSSPAISNRSLSVSVAFLSITRAPELKMKELSLKRGIGDINRRSYPARQLTSAIHGQPFGIPDAFVFRQEPLVVVRGEPQPINLQSVSDARHGRIIAKIVISAYRQSF